MGFKLSIIILYKKFPQKMNLKKKKLHSPFMDGCTYEWGM